METLRIELVTCGDGDWEVLKLNDKIFAENHRLSNSDWVMLLTKLGYRVKEFEVSDEDMEMGNY